MFQDEVYRDKIFSVSELTRLIKIELENSFPSVWVEGEISNYHKHHSGHVYLTLKDEECQLRAVLWRSTAQKILFEMENGLKVVCQGSINIYEPRGEYQLIIEKIEPKGKGALQLAFEQLKEKLNKEGLFDPGKKKKLPLLPKKIGVVTSPKGAAIIDIIRTLERRYARLHMLIYPARVQGKGAAEEIAEGIRALNSFPDIDVILVGRGGGSMEDLWAFNEEIVARAIHESRIPIISAVGHEIDFTIADFAADIRASTPSAAAEMVVEKEEALKDRIENLLKRLEHRARFVIQDYKQEVSELIHHHGFQNVKIRLMTLVQKIDGLEIRALNLVKQIQQDLSRIKSSGILYEERLLKFMREKISKSQAKWEKLSSELNNLSPLNILKKGYTLCWKNGSGNLIRKIDEISLDDRVTVTFYQGEFVCSVTGIDNKKKILSRVDTSRS
ncbi:MAG: exodeoxyribonuclease VII large subunit [Candidatus Aminicenantes bacterium]|nr:exodeoxyribonuclease VII large subunit [Candidatus Aminicenantes bacterium]